MLIFASAFLYWVLVDTLEKEDEQFLTSRIHFLDRILLEGNTEALAREVSQENVGLTGSHYHTYSRILDESGHTLYEAPGMNQEIPPEVFPNLNNPLGQPKKWRSITNRSYLLMTKQTGGGDTSTPRRQIQVALDETGEEVLVSRYERYLTGVLLIGILAATAIGIIIARRGMRPLTDITATAEHVTVSQLHERIDAAQWPQELVSLARAFNGMLDRLEDSFNRLSQFSADLAHELHTPVNNLRGEAEVALSRAREANEYREVLASSLEEYDRLSRMIDSLLFLAKADASQTTLAASPIDAGMEIEKIIAFYEAMAAEQDVRVTCEGNAIINADPILFRRVISNLLSNALHYTSPGGKVSFSIRSVEGGTDVTCCDSGAGIAKEHLPKVFDRFYRISPSRHTKSEGAGLGLAIVKSIVDLHDGDVTIQSVVNEGTSIRLFFPATR